MKNFNPGLHTEHWRILGKQSKPKGQRLILLTDRDSLTAIKRWDTRFLQDSHRELLPKVLKDPKAQHQKEGGVVLDTASLKLVSEGEGDDIPTPSDD
jgi:hypothetical protein